MQPSESRWERVQLAFLTFSLHSRLRAIAVAALGTVPFLPFFWTVSTVLIGVVCLRYGFNEALLVMVGALSPIGLWSWWSGEQPLDVFVRLGALSGILLPAAMLRRTSDWSFVLLLHLGVALVLIAVLNGVGAAQLDGAVEQLKELLANFERRLEEKGAEDTGVIELPTSFQLSVHVASVTSWLMIFALLLARYWQALLGWTGSFREEFLRLRIRPPALAILLVSLCWGAMLTGHGEWVPLLGLPLLLAGISLAHAIIGTDSDRKFLLVLFYVSLILVPVFSLVLITFASADSFHDFRAPFLREDGDDKH